MNLIEKGTYIYNGKMVEYNYATTASYLEQATFVSNATNAVIVDGDYIPLLKDVIFNLKLVQMFTDIDMSQFNDDEYNLDLDKFTEFDEITGVSELVKIGIDDNTLLNLINSVDDNIAYKTGIHKDDISTAITDLIKTVSKRLDTFGDGLDSDMVVDFIDKFNKSGINGEKIVDTYLNSDKYKKNVANIVDSKNADIKDRDERIEYLQKQLNDVTARNVVADKSDKVISIKGE